jgi:hypothetical protein
MDVLAALTVKIAFSWDALIRADKRTDMAKVTDAYRNYANALETSCFKKFQKFQRHCVIKEAWKVRL